jgi:hypothetical protein
MIEFSKGFGKITKCMEAVISAGQMAALTKERTSMTKRKVMVLLLGPMVANTSAHGLMVNKMAWEPTLLHRVSRNKASGKMESV